MFLVYPNCSGAFSSSFAKLAVNEFVYQLGTQLSRHQHSIETNACRSRDSEIAVSKSPLSVVDHGLVIL